MRHQQWRSINLRHVAYGMTRVSGLARPHRLSAWQQHRGVRSWRISYRARAGGNISVTAAWQHHGGGAQRQKRHHQRGVCIAASA